MTYKGPKAFIAAVEQFARLPGIGEKSAGRLVLFLLKQTSEVTAQLARAIEKMKLELEECNTCYGYTDEQPCPVCKDPSRETKILCVVETPSDVFSVEQSGQYKGQYHVLHGRLSPLSGVGPKDLKMEELFVRVKNNPQLQEVILATNPNMEGDATAMYISRALSGQSVRVSRIAMGIPMGGSLEYTDQVTLGRSLSERREFGSR